MRRWIQVAAAGLLAQMLLSPALWWWRPAGAVPPVPLWNSGAPEWVLLLSGGVPAALAIWVLVRPGQSGVWVWLALALGCSALVDVNRLQPWLYWCMLVCACAAQPKPLPALRMVMGGMYIWSGLHKCTPWFALDNFEWFCSAFELTKALSRPALGYAAAALEILMGLGLLYTPSRYVAAWAAVCMHLWIMLVLSPAGLGWNAVVIPWNAALVATLLLLIREDREPIQPAWPLAAWMLVSPLLPVLPRNMGWHLYDNTQPEAVFVRGGQPPTCVRGWDALAYDGGQRLLLDDWAMHTLGVPLLHEDMVFRALHRHLCGCCADAAGMEVLRVNWRVKKDQEPEHWPCDRSGQQMSEKVN